jgi:hypothetical protein
MALARMGANRINNIDDSSESTTEAIQCRLHYSQTRDALLRSHRWRFAKARAQLSEDTNTPDFEWAHQFQLPNDFLAMRSIFEDNATPSRSTTYSYSLEGKLLLTNESSMQIRYTKKVTDVTEFDPLFIEVFVLTLALKLSMPLSQDEAMRADIREELAPLMRKIRAMDREEGDTRGRADRRTWVDARLTNDGRIDSKLGS